jgi:flagellar biosynthetic protein FliR
MAEVQQFLNLTEPQMTYLLLLFMRMTGLFALSPVLGRRNVPAIAKIGLSIFLSCIFLSGNPDAPSAAAIDASNLVAYAMLCAKELLLGLVMGWLTTLCFDVAMMAGQVMDVQIGFGLAQIYDPESQLQVSLLGNLLNYGLLLYFLAVNGHHTLIRIMYLTLDRIPVGQVVLPREIVDVCVRSFGAAVSMAVSVALPIIAAELILEVIMGIMIRTVPQLNIFVVGLSVKILVGLVALLLMIPFYSAYGDRIFAAMFDWIQMMFERMIPAA